MLHQSKDGSKREQNLGFLNFSFNVLLLIVYCKGKKCLCYWAY